MTEKPEKLAFWDLEPSVNKQRVSKYVIKYTSNKTSIWIIRILENQAGVEVNFRLREKRIIMSGQT